MSDEPKKPPQKIFVWRWVLLGLAVTLTAVWLTLTPDGLLGKAHAVGYAVCHQIDARSFHIFDHAMPLCARCSGMFAGAMLGLVYQIAQGRKGKMPPLWVMIILGLMALAWVLDGTNSFTMLIPGINSVYETQNWTRLVTGTGMGMALSAILLPSFIQTVFVRWDEESALGNWKQVFGLMLIAAALDILILLEIPWVLYPIALIQLSRGSGAFDHGLYHGAGNAGKERQYLHKINLSGQLSHWRVYHCSGSDWGCGYSALFMDGYMGGFCPVSLMAQW